LGIGSGVSAVELSTTNTQTLGHFWSAIESSNRPVTVLSFGDSMADSYRSVTRYTFDKLVGRFGSAGYSLNNYRNTLLWNLTNGAASAGPDGIWFCAYSRVPAGGAVWWEKQYTPGGILADSAGIFYVTQTNGGAFRMLLSTNGGPWTTALVLDGYSASPQGHYTNVVLPLNQYRVRVESDSGTNLIIGPSLVVSGQFGIHAAFLDWPGIPLSLVTNVPLAIRAPIIAWLQPDLLIWHMKEPLDGSLSNRMAACESWWKNAAPNCDVLYIGTPWVGEDTNSAPGSYKTTNQNAIVRSVALAHDRAYVDLMNPCVSYPWMVANGYMADPTHLNNAGGSFCADILWDDVGFFALGLDRHIALQQNGNQLQLSYATSGNATYRLESSTNLQHWSVVLTNPVVSGTFATNFPAASGVAYFRLGLTPP